MDFSSFDPQPVFLTAVRLSGVLLASALLMTLCAYKCIPNLRARRNTASPTVDNNITIDTTDDIDSEHIYITRVDAERFKDIVESFATSTCIYPSDNELHDFNDNATCGIIISSNQDDGVIMFELQDTFHSYQDMLDNDFAYDRKYPKYDTKYYYLVFARLFLTRNYPREINADSTNDNTSVDNTSVDNTSNDDSGELPATAFYYAKIDDDNPCDRGHFKRGMEMHMSAPNSPTYGKKELQI